MCKHTLQNNLRLHRSSITHSYMPCKALQHLVLPAGCTALYCLQFCSKLQLPGIQNKRSCSNQSVQKTAFMQACQNPSSTPNQVASTQ